jgi:hypothetical protein
VLSHQRNFDIQHIGAQTRFLRGLVTNRTLVLVCLDTVERIMSHNCDLFPVDMRRRFCKSRPLFWEEGH